MASLPPEKPAKPLISSLVDMGDPDTVIEVMTAYYNLFTPELQCFAARTTPALDWLQNENVKVIVCRQDDRTVGVLAVKDDSVYFPVMAAGMYEEVLASMIRRAHAANKGYLKAQTENTVILDTAVKMNVGVKRNGKSLEMK